MTVNLMVFAVPLFLLCIVIEYLLSRREKKPLYHLNDFTNNLSCGLLEQTAMLPFQGLLIFTYHYLYTHVALFTINPHSLPAWFILWLGVDFLYYWLHRACHRCNFLWAGHSVHHQSRQYNLSVALRQGIIQTIFGWIFYLPLALLGFPTWMFVTVNTLNLIYQFWIHTQLIRSMGWFEFLFNTPSHHRVHHGRNNEYIDKNYAGSLIIWDKLFGTFEPENSPPDYGTTEPLCSWNPFYANVKVLCDTWRYGKNLSSLKTRFLTFFMPPEWILAQLNPDKDLLFLSKIDPNCMYPKKYVFVNILFTIFLYLIFFIAFDTHSISSWILQGLILFNLYLIGYVLNHNHFYKMHWTEFFRSIFIGLMFFLWTHNIFIGLTALFLFYSLNLFFYRTAPTTVNLHKTATKSYAD